MRMLPRVVVTLGVVALAVASAACGSGGGDNDDTPTPGAPRAQPTVDGNTVIFAAKGYRMDVPDGWTFQADVADTPIGSPDYVIDPNAIDGVQANVLINCEPVGTQPPSLEELFNTRAARAQGLGGTGLEELDPVTVDGVEGRVLGYQRTLEGANREGTPTGQVTIARRDLTFLHEGCAWEVAYTAAPGVIDEFQPTVDALVRSFKFIPRE